MRLDRIKLEEQGVYVNSEGKLDTLVGDATIWVPPDVRINSIPGEEGPCIVYPLGGRFIPPIDDSPLARQDLTSAVLNLGAFGWQRKPDTINALEDFIKLIKATPEKIRQFVLKWGPLWRCIEHRDFWTPPGGKYLWFRDKSEPDRYEPLWQGCFWKPYEPLEEFCMRAREAEAAFNIAVRLRENKPASEEIWQPLGHGFEKMIKNLSDQKKLFVQLVSWHLMPPGGPSLRVYWKNKKPELTIYAGWGFIRSVWLMIAQCLTGAKGLYYCDACGSPYIRHKRKPQEGMKQFCPECGKDGKGSKKLWARTRSAPTRD